MIDNILEEVLAHYTMWTEDMDNRLHRKNGWNDVISGYWGKLPDKLPYNSRVSDPSIRTSLLEKNARLVNSKLKGRFVPREGSDELKARINTSLIDYQWDIANWGGTMLNKVSQSDLDARLFGSKFGKVCWKTIYDDKGKVVYDGNEFIPLDVRDSGIDPTARNIRNAKWFQEREWAKFEDLKNAKVDGKPAYKNLKGLDEVDDRRDTAYQSRVLGLKGLTDRTGEDKSYPVVEIVTEYRPDRWITFAPKHSVVIRDIENPYAHRKIPIVQLCYYPLGDDPWGESEVEPVLPLWRAMQYVLNAFMDDLNTTISPPLKVLEGQVRMETLVYGPRAQWIMNSPNAVTEMSGSGASLQYFQAAMSILISRFNSAMGDLSQGTSAFDSFSKDAKTATEVKATQRQQLTRDQKNQNDLAEFIGEIVKMWLSNNKQFLFNGNEPYIIRVVGQDAYSYFERAGLADQTLHPEVANEIQEMIAENPTAFSDADVKNLMESGQTPKYPVMVGKGEKSKTYSKMEIAETGDNALLRLTEDDMDGSLDYVVDVKSMAMGAYDSLLTAQKGLIDMMSNPTILQLLAQENVKPKIKDALVNYAGNLGVSDAQRFFETVQPQQPANPASLPPGMANPGNAPAGAEQVGPTASLQASQPMA